MTRYSRCYGRCESRATFPPAIHRLILMTGLKELWVAEEIKAWAAGCSRLTNQIHYGSNHMRYVHYGPWATALDVGSSAGLSTFRRRRMAMLGTLVRTPAPSRPLRWSL